MQRDLIIAGLIWIGLSVAVEIVALSVDFHPAAKSDKGEEIVHAFNFLVYLAIPVFMFVVVTLVYSIVRQSSLGFPDDDGPPLRGQGAIPLSWLAITGGLTIFMMIYPGIIGIDKIFFQDEEPDLVVEVEGVQWAWLFNYPEEDVSTVNELVLPKDRNVTFEITSRDVLHSFWIPAFLMKIDAVPGLTTEITLKPTEVGSFENDELMRVQCAELCGLAHSKMSSLVTVMEPGEFDAWLAEKAAEPEPTATPSGEVQTVSIIGKDLLFDLDTITVEAGRPVTVSFDNQDAGILHNWALYNSQSDAEGGGSPIVGSEIEAGPVTQQITFDPPDPGSYFFRCDVHPTTMTGEFIVQ
jgi:cytochrome c oxidase subunit 2